MPVIQPSLVFKFLNISQVLLVGIFSVNLPAVVISKVLSTKAFKTCLYMYVLGSECFQPCFS